MGQEEQKQKDAKLRLRALARQYGDGDATKGSKLIINVATNASDQSTPNASEIDKDKAIIQDLFCTALEITELSKASANEMYDVFKEQSLFERFAARKNGGFNADHDFIDIKGQKNQIENFSGAVKVRHENPKVGFKCMHYAVSEASGFIKITIAKKNSSIEESFGVRTKDKTARAGIEYQAYDEVINMKKRDVYTEVEIPIIDNTEWQPDMEFFIELYDYSVAGKPRLPGDDTQTLVTILDEDFPGTLGFEETDLKVAKGQDYVDVKIVRKQGADGEISCMFRTEQFM